MDGWRNSSAHKDSVVFGMRNVNVDFFFIGARDSSGIRKNADNIAAAGQEIIQHAYDVFGITITSGQSDNALNFQNAIALLRTVHGESLLPASCSSHSADLLIQHFMDEEQIGKVRDVVNLFRDPTYETLLLQAGGTRVKTYPPHRFRYLELILLSLRNNWGRLGHICQDADNNIPVNVIDIILHDDDFVHYMNTTLALLDPICLLINECQGA
ncbi:hypothetical protein QAD02_021180 [Eretmocerus hayati]|uniref:Uncharacterized protein n=1 Tax=Eretmocerus hayati TaxID=131215 RepID=A0ACC2PPP9_9HYME|nr:hypothetical protein QAD02_021180 [Eretmocerus hayati]